MERQGEGDVGVAYRQVHDNEGTDARGRGYCRKQNLSFSLGITSVFQADIYAIRYVLQISEAQISPTNQAETMCSNYLITIRSTVNWPGITINCYVNWLNITNYIHTRKHGNCKHYGWRIAVTNLIVTTI